MKNHSRGERIIRTERREEDGAVYTYALIESAPKRIGRLSIPLYSIRVTMAMDAEITENTLTEVFADIGKAITFFATLVENLATPMDLNYIFEDKITV